MMSRPQPILPRFGHDADGRPRVVLFGNGRYRCAIVLIALALISPLTGCVALNIPSDRHHDHADQGGLFGPWKGGTGRPVGLAATAGFTCDDPGCVDGSCGNCVSTGHHAGSYIDDGALTVDPFDTTQGEYAVKRKEEEIPWPRFHPLPTRPIFGNYR